MGKHKKIFIILGILLIFTVIVLRTIVFPAKYELQTVEKCIDIDDTFDMLKSEYEWGEEFTVFNLDAYDGKFPSENGEDYRRYLMCFSTKSYGITELYSPNFIIQQLGENSERLICYNKVAESNTDQFEENTCNFCMYFYTAGLSEEEISEYISNFLQETQFCFTYKQEYVGLREKTFTLAESDVENAEWTEWVWE